MCMRSATTGPASEPSRALHRRGDSISAYELLEVLCEAFGEPTMPLTARKREFLLTHAGIHEGDLRE